MELFAGNLTDKTQADGAQTIELGARDDSFNHQLQIEISAIPAAGSLTVAVKTPGAVAFIDLAPVIDLTTGNQLYKFTGYFSHVRLTPAAFDAEKTYSAYLVSCKVG